MSIMQKCARPECGKAFRVEPSEVGRRTYCSPTCAHALGGERPPPCPRCGDTTNHNGFTKAGVRKWFCPWCGRSGKVE